MPSTANGEYVSAFCNNLFRFFHAPIFCTFSFSESTAKILLAKTTAAAVDEDHTDDAEDVGDVGDDDDAVCSAQEGGDSGVELVMPTLEFKTPFVMSK